MSFFGNKGIRKMILVEFSKCGDQLWANPVPEIVGDMHSLIHSTNIY